MWYLKYDLLIDDLRRMQLLNNTDIYSLRLVSGNYNGMMPMQAIVLFTLSLTIILQNSSVHIYTDQGWNLILPHKEQ